MAVLLCVAIFCGAVPTHGVTPESPEVRELIEAGLRSLEEHDEERLGGLCLIGLAFLKEGASPDNRHIQVAVEACQRQSDEQLRAMSPMYSLGIALIFLAELDPVGHRGLIERYADAMWAQQKPHGGWGYKPSKTGDTSQTQYGALGMWELLQVGMLRDVKPVDACANWLLRTQDPSGAWGYQGEDPGSFELIGQTGISHCMVAAGLGSTMILGNIVGLAQPQGGFQASSQASEAPSALQRAEKESVRRMRTLAGTTVDGQRLSQAVERGQAWFDKNFDVKSLSNTTYPCYYLYAIERYKSFEELLEGDPPEEPEWYQIGYEFLKENQLPGGGWNSRCRKPCATAFGVLFLLRSTQKSIKANLGQGTLVGGRGLSANLARMKLKRGKLVTEAQPTEIDHLLGMLEGDGNESLESLLNDPNALQSSEVGPEQARRLQQLVRSADPAGRILAVRALAKLRDLDYVPTLLYAMTDPDKRVVREARDGLRYVSRRFQGFGLPDNFDDSQRYNALDKWKTWYLRIRPDAAPLP